MSEFKKKMTICSPLVVKQTELLSKNIQLVRFKLDRQEALDVSVLGLGPHLKLIIPQSDKQVIQFPELNTEGKVVWPEGEKPPVRTYSLRSYDPNSNELTVEFVVHDGGIGSSWAQKAKPGDVIGLLGMGAKSLYQDQFLVLVGDISAKPAISYILEHLPENATGQAFIEVLDKSDVQPLSAPKGVKVNWIVRNSHEPSLLLQALDKLVLPTEMSILFWGGMEGSIAQKIRHSLKDRFELDRESLQLVNYWLIGHAEGEFRRREE